jgi:predicted  nucleic acid-binding Zn-ribbon protein
MMHADLVKLIDLQAKDVALSEVDQRLAVVAQDLVVLDQTLQRAKATLEAARRAASDGQRRRDELETKIESYRILQQRRSERLEHVRNPKDASTLMAELDLAQSVMAKEENEWVRSADAVTLLESRVKDEERNVEALESAQALERAAIAERRVAIEAERAAAAQDREASAAAIDKALRQRYDRLRRTRSGDVVVPLRGGACGGCHTSVTLNRRSQIRSGLVLEACEACGAILYPAEPDGSA